MSVGEQVGRHLTKSIKFSFDICPNSVYQYGVSNTYLCFSNVVSERVKGMMHQKKSTDNIDVRMLIFDYSDPPIISQRDERKTHQKSVHNSEFLVLGIFCSPLLKI